MREQLFHRFSIPSIIFRNGHKEMEPQQHPDIHFEESLNDNMFFGKYDKRIGFTLHGGFIMGW